MKSLQHKDLTLVVVRLWAIWHAMHKAVHENQFQSPLTDHYFVECFIIAIELIKPEAKEKLAAQNAKPRWIPPPCGFLKTNVHAATSKNSSLASTTAVAWDNVGNYLGASALVLEGIMDAKMVEAVAMSRRIGVALASDLNLQTLG